MKVCTGMRIVMASLFLLVMTPTLAAEPSNELIQQVNVNTASAETLAEVLQGIGLAKAAEIVSHREMFGAFVSIEELIEVKGIGESLLQRNRDRIILSSD